MNQVATRQSNQMTAVSPKALIEQKSKMMIASLPGNASAKKRFMQAAMGVASSPMISSCEPNSVLKAIYQCARLNLIPDPVLHHVAIVPFRNKGKKEATVIIEYRGLIELMKRANPSLSIKAGTVYQHDDYELLEGSVDSLKITKRWWEKGKNTPGDPVLFYCVVREPGAEPVMVFVPAVEAKKIGSSSKAGMKSGTPWGDHFERMGEKTAIKRIERFVRMDPDKEETKQFREAMEVDEKDLPEMSDDTDLMGAMGGDGDPEDLPQGASRIGVATTAKFGTGAREKTIVVTHEEPPAAPQVQAPPPTRSAKDVHNADDKKKLGMVVDMKLDEAGMATTSANRVKLLQYVSGLDDFAKGSVGATVGMMDDWREKLKTMSPQDVKDMVDPGPPVLETPAEPSSGTPFDRVVVAWAQKNGGDVDAAIAGATRLLSFKHEMEPKDLAEGGANDIISAIQNDIVKLDRYEKG